MVVTTVIRVWVVLGYPDGSMVKNPPARRCRRYTFKLWVSKIPGGGNGNPFGFPVSMPGKSHGQTSLVGYSL